MACKLRQVVWVFFLWMATLQVKAGNDMQKTYRIDVGSNAFTVTPPVPPETEFFEHLPSISLQDSRLSQGSNSVVGLVMHWKFRSGLFRSVAGVVEMQVVVRKVLEGEVASDSLEQNVLSYFKSEFNRAELKDAALLGMQFEEVRIEGRSWFKYKVPIVGVAEYSTALSKNLFLTVQFEFVDNTEESSPVWYQEAKKIREELVKSMRVL